jgi:hypothetical protein
MSSIWNKIKAYLCFGEEDEQVGFVIVGYNLLSTPNVTDASTQQGDPFDFKHVDVDLAGLSEQESVFPYPADQMKIYLLILRN